MLMTTQISAAKEVLNKGISKKFKIFVVDISNENKSVREQTTPPSK